MKNTDLKTLFKTYKEDELFGRYIHTAHIEPLLKKMPSNFKVDVIGQSVNDENIYSVTIGSGSKKVLMWSQMHGNESTTTKALFDIFNLLKDSNKLVDEILSECTLKIIPILNPDGAKAYTRVNTNNVDLNRDAQSLSQPESKVLRNCYNVFKPNYCFNLHGQRTIFSAGNHNKSATVSFLSPAQDDNCTITDNRKVSMSIIAKINKMLQNEIPQQIGVYDDSYNINCVGDTFQTLGIPTILFEAGHYDKDYNREEVRRFIFQSYIVGLITIANGDYDIEDYKFYLKIPENEKRFFDIIIRNANVGDENLDIAIQYEERLTENKIHFIPIIKKIGNLKDFYAHNTLNANGNKVLSASNEMLKIDSENDFVIVNNMKLSLIIDNN